MNTAIGNGKLIETELPITMEEFLVAQGLLPRSVVEHTLARAPVRS